MTEDANTTTPPGGPETGGSGDGTPPSGGQLMLRRLVKIYDADSGVRAVDGVDLTIDPGEFVTLLGPSGCGKTTTLRMIAGFEQPSGGELVLDGRDVTRLPPNRRPVSMVFQSYALFPHLSVRENVGYGLRASGVRNTERQRLVDQALSTMRLTDHAERAPAQLSGGQQQRVALARAMVMRPQVMLFDEPLSNLDAALRERMRLEIRGLQRSLGTTAVYVTHDQAEAMAMSDRVVVLNSGTVEQVGHPAEIYRRPASRFVAGFVGRANLLPAEVLEIREESDDAGGAGPEPVESSRRFARIRVLGGVSWVPAHPEVGAGEPAELLVRPESFRLTAAALGPSAAGVPETQAPRALARVTSTVFMGERVQHELDWEGRRLHTSVADPAEEEILPEGAVVGLGFNPARSWLLPAG